MVAVSRRGPRCRPEHVRPGEHHLAIADGKGAPRVIPVRKVLATLAGCLECEQPAHSPSQAFAVLKGVFAEGLERGRAGRDHLRAAHGRDRTPDPSPVAPYLFHRMREAAMALEAIEAPAGRRSPRSPRSTCIWPATGWLRSTDERLRRSMLNGSQSSEAGSCRRARGQGVDRT